MQTLGNDGGGAVMVTDRPATARDGTGPGQRSTAKIVLVNRFFHPDQSATAQLLGDLAAHLVETGEQVLVVSGRAAAGARGRLPRRERHRGIAITRVAAGPGRGRSLFGKLLQYVAFYPGAAIALLRLLRQGDVVVAKTDPPLVAIIALLAARLRGATLINWLQDLYPEVAAELDTPILNGPIGRWLARARNRALRSAAMNVVIGATMAERLSRLGIPAGQVAIIPNWADEQSIRPLAVARSCARRTWGFAESDFVVGYSGNLGKAHEIDTLLGAARLLRDRSDIRFLFIGGGYHYARLEELVRNEALTSFLFRPQQPREQLRDTLAAADVHWVSLRPELEGLVVPSKFYGILAAGRPTLAVCRPDGEISRIVREQKCGIVVPPGDCAALADAIVRLADEPEWREELGRRARAASERVYCKASALAAWSGVLSRARSSRQPIGRNGKLIKRRHKMEIPG